jgi:NADH-quinone oxidoreductase subunit L
MFMALGIGAWGAAILHLVSHAFFKALLFLAAGVVIQRLDEEHDMFRMGGLRKQMPLVFWTFLAGALSLSAALPVITAGSYSKDTILSLLYGSPGGKAAFVVGLLGVVVTSVYTFRMVFLTFFGPARAQADSTRRAPEAVTLVLLALVAAFGGLAGVFSQRGSWPSLIEFVQGAAAGGARSAAENSAPIVAFGAFAASWLGVVIAAALYLRKRELRAAEEPEGALHRLLREDWGFDALYDRLFVRPFLWLARGNKRDAVDSFYEAIGRACLALNAALAQSQTGRTRQYAAGVAIGTILFVAIMVLLRSWRG